MDLDDAAMSIKYCSRVCVLAGVCDRTHALHEHVYPAAVDKPAHSSQQCLIGHICQIHFASKKLSEGAADALKRQATDGMACISNTGSPGTNETW